jgi:hypothetical protein
MPTKANERTYTITEAGKEWGVTSYNAALKIVRRHKVHTFMENGATCLTESELCRAAEARKNWKGRGPRPKQPTRELTEAK